MGEEYIFECSGISKSFGATHALKNVSLRIRPGEVHALLGENGAGKSTLMKIIIGLIRQDAGTMRFLGEPYQAHGPVDAINSGISMIHQELNLEPHLSIAESVFLNREDVRGKFFLNKKAQNRRMEEILKDFKFPFPPTTLMRDLTLAQCQMVEIMKAVSCNARMIIMDEPTSSLDSEESDRLFETIRNLKAQGVSIIYISHRMEEIFEICDHVTVFRDGTFVDSCSLDSVTRDDLISKLIGREAGSIFPKVDFEIGDVAFKVEGLSGKGFENISFEVRHGEILGLSGLVGSGRSETARAIFGLDPLKSGKMYLEGKEIQIRKPRDAIRRGICMVNEDRRKYGLCLLRSIRENIALPTLKVKQKGLLINQRKEVEEIKTYAEMLRVKCASVEHPGTSLSGGNQQKVVLAKWIMADPKVLILDEPTRGVDVGAKAEIHSLVCQFAAKGVAVIMISSEISEIMGMSDRILIYHEGRLNGEVHRKDILSGDCTQQDILAKEFGQ